MNKKGNRRKVKNFRLLATKNMMMLLYQEKRKCEFLNLINYHHYTNKTSVQQLQGQNWDTQTILIMNTKGNRRKIKIWRFLTMKNTMLVLNLEKYQSLEGIKSNHYCNKTSIQQKLKMQWTKKKAELNNALQEFNFKRILS